MSVTSLDITLWSHLRDENFPIRVLVPVQCDFECVQPATLQQHSNIDHFKHMVWIWHNAYSDTLNGHWYAKENKAEYVILIPRQQTKFVHIL